MTEKKQSRYDCAYLRMALEWAKLSHCSRKKVGAIIVKNRMIISDGYNGTPSGFDNCCENEEGETVSTLKFIKADDPDERNQGLMDVNSMPEDAGMVFYFDKEEPQSFWMMNTPLPLDIMYVNADSVIVSIYKSTVPFSDKSLPSGDPAKYVIETNAGYSISNDIKEGMRVRF